MGIRHNWFRRHKASYSRRWRRGRCAKHGVATPRAFTVRDLQCDTTTSDLRSWRRATHARGAAAGRRADSQRLTASPCLRVLCSNHFSGEAEERTRYSPRPCPPVRVLRSLLAPASQLPSASSALHRLLRAVAPGLEPQPPVVQHLSARRDTVLSGSLCPLGPAPVVKGFRKMVMDQHAQCPASGRTPCVQCEGRGCPCSKQGRDVGSD